MEAQEQFNMPDELICSVCMCVFRNPITIQCGHTFCKICLINSSNLKQTCPICRKVLSHFTQKPNQDLVLAKIIDYFNKRADESNRQQQVFSQKLIETSEQFLLLDIRTNQLLLPYTKVVGTFQLQSPTLINKFQRFVARQEPPFNKYGVISKIIFLNQLRFNVYQCVIEGKSFCKIQNQTVAKNQQLNQQFFYRNCHAKIIYEEQEQIIDQQSVNTFFLNFSKIKDRSILENAYKIVDSKVFNSRNDNLAILYSIFRLLAVEDQIKYDILTKFDNQQRKKFLKQFLANINFDIQKKPNKFTNIKGNKNMKKQFCLYIFSIIVLIFLIYRNQTSYSEL